jgi:uncharacterized membrane protein YgcG
MRFHRAFTAVVAGLTLGSVSPVQAQVAQSASNPWAAFYGCWAPTEGSRSLAVTCVLPAEGAPLAIEQLDVVAGNVVRSVSLHADGRRRDIDAAGCTGWESAAFSVDGARVYARGSATCGDAGEQLTSGLLSITPEGQFLEVSSVRAGEQRSVTTRRYALLPWVEVPPALQPRLAATARLAEGARTRAALPVDMDRLEDALQFADAKVVEAWMAETGVGVSSFRVTRRELERLVAMNAPTGIIDLSVALANPVQFAPRVERAGGGPNAWDRPLYSGLGIGSIHQFDAFCDQLQFGLFSWRGSFPLWSMVPGLPLSFNGNFPECFGRGLYSSWAFGPYGRFGYGYVGNGYVGPGVVVTTEPRRPPGTVTKGRGYTQGDNSTPSGGTGRGRESSGPSTVRASSGSSASSSSGGESSSSGGTRSAGSNGSGRTAQPRNPQ